MENMNYFFCLTAILLAVSGCRPDNDCASDFQYTTANFVTGGKVTEAGGYVYNTIENNPGEYHVTVYDTFPAGTDIVCKALDKELISYTWYINLYEEKDSTMENEDHTIHLKYEDIEQFLNKENEYTLKVSLAVTRQPKMCAPCDQGKSYSVKYITFTGVKK